MIDLAQLPTRKLDYPSEDTQHLHPVWGTIRSSRKRILELEQLLMKAEQEIETLRGVLLAMWLKPALAAQSPVPVLRANVPTPRR